VLRLLPGGSEMRTPEGQVKADIKKLLDSYGAQLYYHMSVQTGFGRRTLDFLICYRGWFAAVEVKRKGGKGRLFQERLVEDIKKSGGAARIVDDVSEVESLLIAVNQLPRASQLAYTYIKEDVVRPN
jgi:hypothetical protein